MPLRVRAAAYVVRWGQQGAEVLVFERVGVPGDGLRVPAGAVREGEEPEQAALRAVAERTGLVRAAVRRQVAVEDEPQQRTRTVFCHLEAPGETADTWNHTVPAAAFSDDTPAEAVVVACTFLPLPLRRPLADDQDAWLGHVDQRWTTVIDVR